MGSALFKAALHLGGAHLLHDWPQAKEWLAPTARAGKDGGSKANDDCGGGGAFDAEEISESTGLALFGDAPSGGRLSWPAEPMRVASKMQATARPPGGFFDVLRLRASFAPAGGYRRMLTFELPPTVRTLDALTRAAADIACIDTDCIEGVLKLPDILLAEVRDVQRCTVPGI